MNQKHKVTVRISEAAHKKIQHRRNDGYQISEYIEALIINDNDGNAELERNIKTNVVDCFEYLFSQLLHDPSKQSQLNMHIQNIKTIIRLK